MNKTWLITGCSGGFGLHLARMAAARGDHVVATARAPETLRDLARHYPDTLRVAALDVTKPETIQAAIALTAETFGRLDVLVNNAGHGFMGAIEEGTPEEYRPLFDVNVFGLVETTRAALPLMRRTGGGRIVSPVPVSPVRVAAAITTRRSLRSKACRRHSRRNSNRWAFA